VLFVGIDGEMSAPDIQSGGELIQFGLAVMVDGSIQSISYLLKPSPNMHWDPTAAKIHLIPRDALDTHGVEPAFADEQLYQWLVKLGANQGQRAKTVPVGFNITGFDLPFVKKTLPRVFSLLSRRTAELNGMLWLLDGKNNLTFEAWKKRSLDYAHSKLEDYVPHDAEWDAKRHLLCFEYLRSVILVG